MLSSTTDFVKLNKSHKELRLKRSKGGWLVWQKRRAIEDELLERVVRCLEAVDASCFTYNEKRKSYLWTVGIHDAYNSTTVFRENSDLDYPDLHEALVEIGKRIFDYWALKVVPNELLSSVMAMIPKYRPYHISSTVYISRREESEVTDTNPHTDSQDFCGCFLVPCGSYRGNNHNLRRSLVSLIVLGFRERTDTAHLGDWYQFTPWRLPFSRFNRGEALQPKGDQWSSVFFDVHYTHRRCQHCDENQQQRIHRSKKDIRINNSNLYLDTLTRKRRVGFFFLLGCVFLRTMGR